jgi:hypothetical protein
MYLKYKSYPLSRHGQPIAFILIKVNPLNLKLKALITLESGQTFELINQWASEEEFYLEIENFVKSKLN